MAKPSKAARSENARKLVEDSITADLAPFNVDPEVVQVILKRLPSWWGSYLNTFDPHSRFKSMTKAERSAEARRMANERWSKNGDQK